MVKKSQSKIEIYKEEKEEEGAEFNHPIKLMNF
jgi:hypothetical protein